MKQAESGANKMEYMALYQKTKRFIITDVRTSQATI
jgi:hypothetical protein